MSLTDWIGIVGSFTLAGAYFSVSSGRLNGEAPPYNLLNLLGSTMILMSLYFKPNAGAIVVEVLWAIIALLALWKWYRSTSK